jgi:putative redox protein
MQTFDIPAGENSLMAFLHPAPSGLSRPVLVVCHGFCGSAEGGSSLDLALTLHDRDISLLRFRFTPQRCLSQQVAEIGSVIEYCRTNLTQDIALLGRSMGAAAALAFASIDRRVSGLCLMASPADLPSTFRGILGDDYTRLEQGQSVTAFHEDEPVHLTPDFIRDFAHYDLPAAIREIAGTPLMIIHGMEDATVPVEQGRQLFFAAGEPKRLLLLPDHGHSFTGCAERFVPAVADWLTQEVFPASV